jgi:YfiH family protein
MSLEPPSAAARRFLGRPPHIRSKALDVPHGFFGREGGVSQGVYASLNAGRGSRDDSSAVEENRRRIAAAIGAQPGRLIGVHQVHSAKAVRASAPWEGARPEADGLITTEQGLALSVLTADCAPVLLADREAGVIGAAHAGWRGALSGVLETTVALMIEAGARPASIAAAIGPCIGQASYEVGPEFEAEFLARDPANSAFFLPGPGDRRQFDLPRFAARRLDLLGVAQVEMLAFDTCASAAQFFSNRRGHLEGAHDYGRNCSAIMLPL